MANQEHEQRADIVIAAAMLAAEGALSEEEATIARRWPHRVTERTKRTAKEVERLKAFLDDGFRCRYTGERVFFTPLLEALSVLWPETFPTHRNWKSEECHDAYWSHTASLDHVDPVSIGGKELSDNWVTTSAARNMVRSRFSLASLGWEPKVRTRSDDWDGGVRIFLTVMERHRGTLAASERGAYLQKWERLALSVLSERATDSA